MPMAACLCSNRDDEGSRRVQTFASLGLLAAAAAAALLMLSSTGTGPNRAVILHTQTSPVVQRAYGPLQSHTGSMAHLLRAIPRPPSGHLQPQSADAQMPAVRAQTAGMPAPAAAGMGSRVWHWLLASVSLLTASFLVLRRRLTDRVAAIMKPLAATASTQQQPEVGLQTAVSATPTTGVSLLEHINVNVPQQQPAYDFYFGLLGCAVDPRRAANIAQGKGTMWANIGISQIHIPVGDPQVIPGVVNLTYPSLNAVRRRLGAGPFRCIDVGSALEVHCPYGNVYVLRETGAPADPRGVQPIEGDASLGTGMAGLELRCKPGAAAGIGRFYRHYFEAEVTEEPGAVTVKCGTYQTISFCEGDEALPPYDGHHMAMYMASMQAFQDTFKRLDADGLVWVNTRFSDASTTLSLAVDKWQQFRILEIRDPLDKSLLHTLEHEIRAPTHEACPFTR
uniref:VOC domain-containing protein n=1 Tax=Eutreptiella gymnastica TaxID=73025 RepID=A0A7S1NL54_9EUGL